MPFDALPESLVSDLVKLRLAREGFAARAGWQQHAFGLNPNEPQHCLIGWMLHVADGDEREATRLTVQYLFPALPLRAQVNNGSRIHAVYSFNDNHNRFEVAEVFDRAVQLAAKQQGQPL